MDPTTPTGSITTDEAIDRLRDGGVVAFPTETVWGLGADATNPDAVRRVYEIKGRPSDKPMPVLVADIEMARTITRAIKPRAERIARAFWPGPLTLVLPASESIIGIVTGGGDTVGIRAPGLAPLLELVRSLGRPIIAPSANPSGQPPCQSVSEVRGAFAGELASGALACLELPTPVRSGGKPSTLLVPGESHHTDCILREGPIGRGAISRVP